MLDLVFEAVRIALIMFGDELAQGAIRRKKTRSFRFDPHRTPICPEPPSRFPSSFNITSYTHSRLMERHRETEYAQAVELETNQTEVTSPFEQIQLRAGGNESFQQRSVDRIVEQEPVVPFRGQKSASGVSSFHPGNQVTGCSRPFRKEKMETRVQKAARYNAAALKDQLRLGTHQPGADFNDQAWRRQANRVPHASRRFA